MGKGIIITILIVVFILIAKPDILDKFKDKEEPSQQNQSVLPIKTDLGKPIQDNVTFDCIYDSDCIFYNDRCNNDCRCEEGTCVR